MSVPSCLGHTFHRYDRKVPASQRTYSPRILLAFASVYLFWGSTYLAIKVAGQHLPVPVVSGSRCLVSSVVIGALCLLTGRGLRVRRGEGWKLALIGLLFMSGNNMLLTWGETMVPSVYASLIVSTMPIIATAIASIQSISRADTCTSR